jgi:hypothetical protein
MTCAILKGAVVLAGAACLPAAAQTESCTPEAGDCFVGHATPGCQQPECCEAVCIDQGAPDCCTIAWDEFCSLIAAEVCEPLACPNKGSCFEPHENVGCDDATCCEHVCSHDSFCCNAQWDELCVEEASTLCDDVQVEITPPAEATEESELCGERLNDGCNMDEPFFDPLPCGALVHGTSNAGPRDTDWYAFTAASPSTLTVSVTAEFPARVLLLRGECLGAVETLTAASVDVGTSGGISECVDPGSYWVVVTTGTDARPIRSGIPCPDPKDPKFVPGFYGNDYLITAACSECVEPVLGDLNGDGLVDGADLGLLLANWDGSGLGDLNGDGTVNGADLGILLAAWST